MPLHLHPALSRVILFGTQSAIHLNPPHFCNFSMKSSLRFNTRHLPCMPPAKLPAAYGPALWQAITKHLYIKTKHKKMMPSFIASYPLSKNLKKKRSGRNSEPWISTVNSYSSLSGAGAVGHNIRQNREPRNRRQPRRARWGGDKHQHVYPELRLF